MATHDPKHDGQPVLLDANRADVLQTIEFGMRYSRGKPSNAAREIAVSVLTGMVLDHMESCGFVIKRRPPAPAHSAPGTRLSLKD